ncbi:MAG TPA: hypothetical protein PLA41_02695 [Candidatus Pacearchaeota archaeon]|nr:hypothetical protein [Candidatus Parcubacteria bacterium]HNZ83967.1 hypothetical protein [Candidatus Pacearchaeota archaeon]HOU46032.1 hypothetical protein [Candidatus Pacearchaeota archaeon]HPM08471.1 hypothetical protein [Candidatus Pacearchaeota archaeon]HQI74857.1 hypothetical protein [Candidatus Pacearchaeota archaeon]
MKKIIYLSAACLLIIIAFSIFNQQKIANAPFVDQSKDNTNQDQLNQEEKKLLINEYLENHISEISPQKEVLGGKFYITSLEINPEDKATVEYEDGHIVVKAVFDFQIKNKEVFINNFKILPQEDLKKGDIIKQNISSFDECAQAGYAVMESYPRQCRTADGKIFIEGK